MCLFGDIILCVVLFLIYYLRMHSSTGTLKSLLPLWRTASGLHYLTRTWLTCPYIHAFCLCSMFCTTTRAHLGFWWNFELWMRVNTGPAKTGPAGPLATAMFCCESLVVPGSICEQDNCESRVVFAHAYFCANPHSHLISCSLLFQLPLSHLTPQLQVNKNTTLQKLFSSAIHQFLLSTLQCIWSG